MKCLRLDCARRRSQRGAAAVEFALIMPILLMLVFGAIQYGIYFWSSQGGSDAARSASRSAATSEPIACDAFRDAVVAQINRYRADGTRVTIERKYFQSDSPTTPVPAAENVDIGDLVQVRVRFSSIDLSLPLIPTIQDGVVDTTAKTRVEFLNGGNPEDCSYVNYLP
jgi:Flp pilus assembly protein TadG